MILGYVVLIFPLAAAISLLLYLPVYIRNRSRYGKRPVIRHLVIYMFLGIVVSILFVTIFLGGIPSKAEYRFLNLIPFIWMSQTYGMGFQAMVRQLLINVVMTIPMGFILPMVFSSCRRWWKSLLWIAGFITMVETVQYFIGRSADIDDLIMNSLGGVLGYLIYALARKLFLGKEWWNRANMVTDDAVR